MSAIQYRTAQSEDIEGIARLRALKRGTYEYWNHRVTQYFEGEHNPQHSLLQRTGFVAEENEVIIGFVTGHLTRRYGCDGEVQWIDVAPEQRRNGIASELLRVLAQWFVEQNALKVCVNVDSTN